MLKHAQGRKAENYVSASSERSEASHSNQLTFLLRAGAALGKVIWKRDAVKLNMTAVLTSY